jgi:O-antigen/teichoic acid export membrane protein
MAVGRLGSLVSMYLVSIKLIEVLARALFTVGVTFALPLASAGQFGILVTLIGLFAFGFGWERHIDLQRTMVGTPDAEFDRAVIEAFWLYIFNYLVMLPIFCVLAMDWAEISVDVLILAVIVVISEHISNQLYNITLVQPRYYRPITVVAVKNILIVGTIAISILIRPDLLSLHWVMLVWSLLSAAGTLVIAALWIGIASRDGPSKSGSLLHRIFSQHRISLTHFLIGLLGILMLQFDRIAVGSLLDLEETGIYFRNILLVSFAYQFFNIASYNRILPRIFAESKTHAVSHVLKIAYREIAKVSVVVIAALGALVFVNALVSGFLATRFNIDIALITMLLAAALIRVSADFHGLIINAKMREKILLRCQIVTFGIGASLLLLLTYQFGMFGTATASIASSSTYLILTRLALMRLSRDSQ